MQINILLTCVNSQVAPSIIKLLEKHPTYDIRVIGTDTKPPEDCISTPFLSDYFQVPMGDDESYVPIIIEIVKQKSINIILCGSDEEVISLSKFQRILKEKYNCKVCCSPYNIVKNASDKYKLMNILKSENINVTNFYSLEKIDDIKKCAILLGYPNNNVIIKPRFGRGSKGFRVISSNYDEYGQFFRGENLFISIEELVKIFSFNPSAISNYFLMEYLPGDKYSADCLVTNGEVVSMVIRNNGKKPKISPPTQIADIVFDKDIRAYVKRIIKSFMFDYFIQIEVGRDNNGQPQLIEANTRLDATLPITMGLGINFYHELITYAMEGKYDVNIPDISEFDKKVRFIRYWDHYFKELPI